MSDKMDWDQRLIYAHRYAKKDVQFKSGAFNVKNADHAQLTMYVWLNVSCNCPYTPQEALDRLKEDLDVGDDDEEPVTIWADIKERKASANLRSIFKWWIPRLLKAGYLKAVDYKDGHCDECEEEEARKQPEPPKPEPPKPEPPKKRTFKIKKEGWMEKALREKAEERASSAGGQRSPS
jgi:hypothetical protein